MIRAGLASALLATAALALVLAGCGTPTVRFVPSPAPVATRIDAALPDAKLSFVANATAMLGQPYRYGGAAPGGFDCSGLVVYAGARAGISLPRTAREQLQTGTPVARAELKPGDLVFMHLSHKILHVGIAIDANRFVHAPATGKFVRIDSLAAPTYAGAFMTARRID